MAFVVLNGFFFEFLTPFTLGRHNFLTLILFLITFNLLNAQRGRLQVLFAHQKQKNPPLAAIL
jgi:hypothetical protein